MATVEGTGESTIGNQSMSVLRKDRVPAYGLETTRNGQFKNFRLWLRKHRNVKEYKIMSKIRAALSESSLQTRDGSRFKSSRAMDRHIISLMVISNIKIVATDHKAHL